MPITDQLNDLDPARLDYADQFVRILIAAAELARASDVHLQPRESGVEVCWRIDGVLHRLGVFANGEQADPITRLKVLAGLLTYRQELPQEGRIRDRSTREIRLATFPTVFGERAVLRLFAPPGDLRQLGDLGLPDDVRRSVERDLECSSGAVVIAGPAGSGKTTTAYACLRSMARRAVMTIEDPVESLIEGTVQSQTNIKAGFDLASGIRSLLRQDPEVILVGEIRDPETAAGAFSAALTGHLLLTTLHAGSAPEAAFRLIDMGVPPHTLRAILLSVIGQRLVRRRCSCANSATTTPGESATAAPAGCEKCQQTGFCGRLIVAEYMDTRQEAIRQSLRTARTSQEIQLAAESAGMVSWRDRAHRAVAAGLTTSAEVESRMVTTNGDGR